MFLQRRVAICALILLGSNFSLAYSAIIPSLYSTGVDDFHAPLISGSIDFHYQLISFPAGSGYDVNTYVADTSQPPIDTGWASPGSNARWIAPTSDVVNMPSATTTGDYVYETIFDLTGFDHTTAVITGQWTADDTAPVMLLNDVPTGFALSGPGVFGTLHSFTLTSGFVAGFNSLKFQVNNAVVGDSTNPCGLLIVMTGSANVVPEPSTWVTLASGAFFAGLYRRRHRQTVQR